MKLTSTLFLLFLVSIITTGCINSTKPSAVTNTPSNPNVLANISNPPKLPVNQLNTPHIADNNFDLQKEITKATLSQHAWLTPKVNATQDELIWNTPVQPKKDLWREMSSHFYLAPAYTDNYKSYIQFYAKKPRYLQRVSKRAKPYLYFVLEEIKKRQMPYELALLPIVESGYSPFAKSYVSATGLWQFMPSTGQMFGLHKNWWYDGRQDIYTSTQAALDYLQELYRQNNHDWLLALASYNSGYGNVLKAKRKYLKKHPGESISFWKIRNYLPDETKHYVPQLLAISYIIDHQDAYSLSLEPIKNSPYFKKIALSQQMGLINIAKKTNTSMKNILALNPGFLRSATPPKGNHQLLLPTKSAQKFKALLIKNPTYFNVHWARHTIKPGESLSVIAEHYGTSIKQIKNLNGLKNSQIRTGKVILIPVTENYARKLAIQPVKKYNGKKHYHRVKRGESLWTIARYYNISTRKLCEWNKISIKAPLRKYQRLEIRSSKYGKKIAYTLKKGDSLWKVAKKYSVTIADLSHWNRIKQKQLLQPGTKINIWVKG